MCLFSKVCPIDQSLKNLWSFLSLTVFKNATNNVKTWSDLFKTRQVKGRINTLFDVKQKEIIKTD